MNPLISLILCLFFINIRANAQVGSFKDIRDNQTYQTTVIGGKVWMTQNFNYKTKGSHDFILGGQPIKGFGKVYTYEAALSSIPQGWHLPSLQEWKDMLTALGLSAGPDGYYQADAVTILTSDIFNLQYCGYSTIGMGQRTFDEFDETGQYWTQSTSDKDATSAYKFIIFKKEKKARFTDTKKDKHLYVRLIKDY